MAEPLQKEPVPAQVRSARDHESEALGRLEGILARAQARGVRRLAGDDLEALPALVRFAATRLSRAQTAGADPRRIQQLTKLLSRSHGLLYRDLHAAPGTLLARVVQLLLRDGPRAIRREWRMLLLTLAVFYGIAGLSYWLVSRDLSMAFTFMGAEALAQELEQLRETSPGEAFRGNFTFGWGASAHTAGWIMANNIGVAVLLFGSALLPPLFALLLLINALMVGTYLGVAAHWDQAASIGSIMLCHGMLELQALALAGAAGLVLARGLYLPGAHSRPEALRLAGAHSWRLFSPVLPILVAAGTIEGYVSPHAGLNVRLAVALVSALLLVAWIGVGGRNPRSR